jgi:hypothetical protein
MPRSTQQRRLRPAREACNRCTAPVVDYFQSRHGLTTPHRSTRNKRGDDHVEWYHSL